MCRAAAFLSSVYSRLQTTQPDRADAHCLSASASLTQAGRRRRHSCADAMLRCAVSGCLCLLSICLQPAAAESEWHLLCAAEEERTGGVVGDGQGGGSLPSRGASVRSGQGADGHDQRLRAAAALLASHWVPAGLQGQRGGRPSSPCWRVSGKRVGRCGCWTTPAFTSRS